MAMGFLRIDASARAHPASSSSTPSTPTTPRFAMSSAGHATPKTRELAPFLRLLREMLNTEPPTVIRWTPDGRAFEILDLHQMTHVVLPKYFKHRKYASFQRQLNYFHFRKWTKSRSPLCTFANPFFLRDAPELTWHIVRKRDLSHKSKRPRAQSDDPKDDTGRSPRSCTASASAEALVPAPLPLPLPLPLAGQAAAAAAASDPHGLLQWIDTQFPSIASIELLDDSASYSHSHGVESCDSSVV